ncbi:MAG: hypothetical protein GWP19_04340 [Planctomycetia bacterium]|nr:hypothetical protein [Planctomycetia bacterium]
MNIEKQIQSLFSEEHAVIDSNSFLDRLHSTREKRIRNQQRISYGISMSVIVLLVGILAITQLDNNAFDIQYNQYFADAGISEEMLDEYYNDLAVYLVEESDDIWATMEFFYEANYQPMKEILETKI